MKRCPFGVVNLGPAGDPNRGAPQIRREIGALAEGRKVVGTVEALGYRLPYVERMGSPIHDTSKRSRANLALYVLAWLDVEHTFVDLVETWPRTKHPGTHEPRSILVAQVEDWRVVVSHAPPNVPGAGDARAEWLAAMRRVISGSRWTLALTDPNGLGDEIAAAPTVVTRGTSVEAAHARNVDLDAEAVTHLGRVPFLGDHRRALVGTARKRRI